MSKDKNSYIKLGGLFIMMALLIDKYFAFGIQKRQMHPQSITML